MLDKVVNFFLVNAAIALPLAVALTLVVSSSARAVFKWLLRVSGRLILIAAVVALVYDATRTFAGGSGVVMTSLWDHWNGIAPASLEIARKFLATTVHPMAWEMGLKPVLALPASLVAAVTGLALVWIGRRRREVAIFVN